MKWIIQASNEEGGGEPAWLLAAVVDEKILGPADARAVYPSPRGTAHRLTSAKNSSSSDAYT